MLNHTWRRVGLPAVAGLLAAPLAACGSGGSSSSGGTLTLGYFPNLTHGSASSVSRRAEEET